MLKADLTGRIIADPQLRTASNGHSYYSLAFADNYAVPSKNDDNSWEIRDTYYHHIQIYDNNPLFQQCANIGKGDVVELSGNLRLKHVELSEKTNTPVAQTTFYPQNIDIKFSMQAFQNSKYLDTDNNPESQYQDQDIEHTADNGANETVSDYRRQNLSMEMF